MEKPPINQSTRKPTRLRDFDYSATGVYHIIICSKNRECIFSKIDNVSFELTLSEIGELIKNSIEFLNQKSEYDVDKYVIMPNHIHILLSTENDMKNHRPQNSLLSKFVSSLKRFTNRQAGMDLWQSSYYDRIVRNEKEYMMTWKYIDEYPVDWALDEYYHP